MHYLIYIPENYEKKMLLFASVQYESLYRFNFELIRPLFILLVSPFAFSREEIVKASNGKDCQKYTLL
jgi:hypothetical protein